jgi:uncharacterized membrane protein YphA (DoxX/SURF4 family)
MNYPIYVSVSKWLIAIGTLLLSLVNLSSLTTLGYKLILVGIIPSLITLIGCILLLIGVKDSRWRIFAGIYLLANIAVAFFYYWDYKYIYLLDNFDYSDISAQSDTILATKQVLSIVASICNVLSVVSVIFIFNRGHKTKRINWGS